MRIAGLHARRVADSWVDGYLSRPVPLWKPSRHKRIVAYDLADLAELDPSEAAVASRHLGITGEVEREGAGWQRLVHDQLLDPKLLERAPFLGFDDAHGDPGFLVDPDREPVPRELGDDPVDRGAHLEPPGRPPLVRGIAHGRIAGS